MDLWQLFPTISGYEWVEGRLRLYVDGPNPKASFTRDRGVRTVLFHLYDGTDAEAVKAWLAVNRAWQCLRVPSPFCRKRAARGILIAGDWHGGTASAVHLLSRTRIIRDEIHRERLLREVRATIHSVLENPVSGNEFGELQLLEDVILVSPVMVELATTGELRDAVVGSNETSAV